MTSIQAQTISEIIFGFIDDGRVTVPYNNKLSSYGGDTPPDDSILGRLRKSPHNKIFTELVERSNVKEMLSDPQTKVTLFLPPDRILIELQPSLYKTLNEVELNEFVRFHIVKGLLPYDLMMYQRSYAETLHSYENLEINGLGLSPSIGSVAHISAVVPMVWKQAHVVTPDIRVGNSLIHIIDLPLHPSIY
jgi:uncharacterized surface protein with fasciclin (FAS1) repeats